ncbi:hypothetical protein [Collinsella sp. Sow4_E3]|uniref:hypothetical protein n=1 Tax=Collinsella sp. Sow4_E3 TaxID=3438776 RepID=UPI003F8F2C04
MENISAVYDIALDFQMNSEAIKNSPEDLRDFVNEIKGKGLTIEQFIKVCKDNRWFVTSMNRLLSISS